MPESPMKTALTLLAGNRHDWKMRRPAPVNRPAVSAAWIGPSVIVGTTAVGWFAFKDAVGEEDPVAFALFIGAVSIVLMAWSNLLSTRVKMLEHVFGGLDRIYAWHRWFGALSVAAMWYHVQTIDDVEGIRGASESVADAAEDLAGLGETALYLLALVSVIRWVPYRWWKISHKFMIVPFVFSSWHFHTATKPYANSDAWGRWFQALMLMGIVTWVYRVVWCDMFRRGRRYSISSIETRGTLTSIEMAPAGRPIRFRAGQFAFFSFERSGLAEPHPFTIASHPDEHILRIHVKDLGDWSSRLGADARVGDTVRVDGPYGALPVLPHDHGSTTVWIAGGVGITPFLSAVKNEQTAAVVPHLFLAVRSRDDAPELDELRRAHDEGRVVLHLFVSGDGNRLGRDAIVNEFGDRGLDRAHVVMCGPDSLVREMTRVVRRLGAHRVHVEAFDMRSGFGPDLSREVDAQTARLRRRLARSG